MSSLPILLFCVGLQYVVVKLGTVGLWELHFDFKRGTSIVWKGPKGLEGGGRAWGESLFLFIYLHMRFTLFVC